MKVIIDFEKKTVSDENGIVEVAGWSQTFGPLETFQSTVNYQDGKRIAKEYDELLIDTWKKVFQNP